MPVSQLCVRLTTKVEWLWATYRDGRPLTPYMLTKMLKRYGVNPEQKRRAPRTRQSPRERGFWREDLDPVFERYLTNEPADGVSRDGETRPPVSRVDDPDVGGSPPASAPRRETRETRSDGASEPREIAHIPEGIGVSRDGETRGVRALEGLRDTAVQETAENFLTSHGNGHSSQRWTEVDPTVFYDRWAERRA